MTEDLSELATRACCNVVGDVFVHAISEELTSVQLVDFVATMMFCIRIVVMQVLEPPLHSRVIWHIENFTSKKMVRGIKRSELCGIERCLNFPLKILVEGILVLKICDECVQGR